MTSLVHRDGGVDEAAQGVDHARTSVCEYDELMAPRAWAEVPAKSTMAWSPSMVTEAATVNSRPSSTPSVSITYEPCQVPSGRPASSWRMRVSA